MQLRIEGHRAKYNAQREAMDSPPSWWVALPEDRCGVDISRVDRVDNTGFGDIYEVTWWGFVDGPTETV